MQLIGESFGTVMQQIFGNRIVLALLALIAADVMIGTATALRGGSFHLAEVANFLLTKSIPYILGAGAMQLMLLAVPPELGGFAGITSGTVWTFVILAEIGHNLDGIRQLFPGLGIPAFLGAQPKPEVKATP